MNDFPQNSFWMRGENRPNIIIVLNMVYIDFRKLYKHFSFLASELQSFLFLFQENDNSTKNELSSAEDVHIYVIDSSNSKMSMTVLEQRIERRTRKDKGFWFIDISMFKTLEEAKLMLDNLSLDIDDDIFAFMLSNETTINIWDIYKVVPENDSIVKCTCA